MERTYENIDWGVVMYLSGTLASILRRIGVAKVINPNKLRDYYRQNNFDFEPDIASIFVLGSGSASYDTRGVTVHTVNGTVASVSGFEDTLQDISNKYSTQKWGVLAFNNEVGRTDGNVTVTGSINIVQGSISTILPRTIVQNIGNSVLDDRGNYSASRARSIEEITELLTHLSDVSLATEVQVLRHEIARHQT